MLTPQEQAELAALEQEEVQALQVMPQTQDGGLTPQEAQELAMLEQEEIQAQQAPSPKVNPSREASLGFVNRSRFAIEPLESNRRALLAQEYGQENVMEDERGNVYLRQGNEFRPVNKEGFSTADIADIGGALPEAIGGGVGALVGAIGGGGVASLPAAMGLGAVGGAAGSAARQGASALLGTPQIANARERVTEAGMSAAFGAIGSGAGKLIAEGAKKAAPYAKRIFPKLGISKEGLKLSSIAKKEGIPMPTPAQMAGGRDLDLEKVLAARPVYGYGIRKTVDKQVDAIKSNLSSVAGDFMDVDSAAPKVGAKIQEGANRLISGIKQTARDQFDNVAKEGAGITVPADRFASDFLENLKGIGLFDDAGNAMAHSSKSGLTKSQFDRLQEIGGKILQDAKVSGVTQLPGSKSGLSGAGSLDVNTINTMRKFIDANIKEGSKQGYDDALLIKMREAFLDVTENMLGSKDEGLKNEFKSARALWKRHLDMKDIIGRKGLGIDGLSEEKVIQRIFRDKKSVQQAKQVLAPKEIEEAGKTFLNDLFSTRLGKEGQIGAANALKVVKENKEAIIESLGQEAYSKIRNNLFMLDKIGAPVNPSRTEITRLMGSILDPKEHLQGIAQTVERKARGAAAGTARSLVNTTRQLPQRAGGVANILGDNSQRAGAYFTRGPAPKFTRKEEENNGRAPSRSR